MRSSVVGARQLLLKTSECAKCGKAEREYLDDQETGLMWELTGYIEKKVDLRIRHRKRSSLETMISEEAQLSAKCLRNQMSAWITRIAVV